MSALAPTAPLDGAVAIAGAVMSLPALIDRASAALANARGAAEVLEARDIASIAYDVAKKVARMATAKQAHDELIAAAYRAQADALQIESEAKRRLADEYDAAQERGEVVGPQGGGDSTVPVRNAATAADVGLSRKDIHEARMIRDAELAHPGIVRKTVDAAVAAGAEPSKAAVRRAVQGAARPIPRDTQISGTEADNTIGKPNGSSDTGPRINIPDGVSLSDLIRRGLKLEQAGTDAETVAKQLGVGLKSYRQARDIVLLADRDDLGNKDSALACNALAILDGEKRTAKAHGLVQQLVQRIWGDRGVSRNAGREAQRVESFNNAISVIVEACERGSEINIPHLSHAQADSAFHELSRAEGHLRALKAKIKETHQ